MSKPKRLFVVDAMAMAFRNFHAFGMRPLTTSSGTPTSAIFGSANFLLKLIADEKPDYLAIAKDSREATFRHEMFENYKANRTEMPEDLAVQLPWLDRLYDALDVPVLVEPGLEADDLIGSLVRQVGGKDLHCYIVSGDKDFMQLVNEETFLYSPKKGGEVQITDIKGVAEKFGCTPELVIDVLAIMGDSSDNVPGVPGIGEKGAIKLVSEYGSLEQIYQHLDEITNKRQRNGLEQNRELAALSKNLVTIKTDATIHHGLDELKFDPQSIDGNEKLKRLFQELEFSSLVRRVAGSKESAVTPVKANAATKSKENTTVKTIAAPEQVDYQQATTYPEIAAVCRQMMSADAFAFDTETTGLDVVNDKPIGISLSCTPGKAYYIPLETQHLSDELSEEQVRLMMHDVLTAPNVVKVAHNLKYDLQMLNNIGIIAQGPFSDTMLLSYLRDSSSKSHGLDHCALIHCHHKMIPITELIGEDKSKSMRDVPLEQLTPYAAEDADYTLRLFEILRHDVTESQQDSVLNDIEIPLVPVLAKMEQQGVFVDADILVDISESLDSQGKELQKEIYELAGAEFNINSTKQLQKVIFEDLKIHESLNVSRIKKTKSGFSTDSSVMERLSEHPLPRAVLEYRQVTKLKSTYVDTLPQLINPTTGRIHTSFHQTGTTTGRLSSSDPNLQNIPIRSDRGKQIRKAFRAQKEGWWLVSADYSQVELRLLAHIAKEPALIQAFGDDLDIHAATAAKIFQVDLANVTSELRSRAKAINFGIIYGMGPQRLARETGVSLGEAKSFIEMYFEGFPKIQEFINDSISNARKLGFSQTIAGRRRPIHDLDSKNRGLAVNAENMAVNSPVQGSAADLIKLAMIKIDAALKADGLKSKMLMQVHDELVFEVPQEELTTLKRLVKQNMENALELDVPLKVEIGEGKNWLEAH